MKYETCSTHVILPESSVINNKHKLTPLADKRYFSFDCQMKWQ